MSNEQTSVNWFMRWIMDNPEGTYEDLYLAHEHAKELELKMLMDCWIAAHQAGRFEEKGIANPNWVTFEQYMKDRYVSEESDDTNESKSN